MRMRTGSKLKRRNWADYSAKWRTISTPQLAPTRWIGSLSFRNRAMKTTNSRSRMKGSKYSIVLEGISRKAVLSILSRGIDL